MNLITPDTGLLFWMVVIFGLVFFLLWKFGCPIITDMVDKRNATIEKSLKDAHEIEARMGQMVEEHARMLDETRKEQAQEADDNGEQGGTLDHTGGDDHRGTEVAGAFGLTRDGFHRGLTDLTDTERSGEGRDGGGDAEADLAEGGTGRSLENHSDK